MMKIGLIPNDAEGIAFIKKLKANAKNESQYKDFTIRIRAYGRCKDKVTAFKETGRVHQKGSSWNTIGFNTPQAKYCHSWMVFIETHKRVKCPRNTNHSWVDDDNEGCYGYEHCRFCGQKRHK